MWIVASMVAFAAEPVTASVTATPPGWRSKTYAQPRMNGRLVSVNGRPTLQALGGVEVGLAYEHRLLSEEEGETVRGPRDLIGRTRVQTDVLYGLVSQSTGYGVRLGSFIGPTSSAVTYQFGPDVWANQYGSPTGADYHLPFAVGVDLMNLVIFQLNPDLSAQVGIIPGWAFMGPRRQNRIGPFHELSGFALVSVRAQGVSFNLGYQRQYNYAGVFDGLILSGGL